MHRLVLLTAVSVWGLLCTPLMACLGTYQHKIFPVGYHGDTIVSVDVQIQRMDQYLLHKRFGAPIESNRLETHWVLRFSMVHYGEDQLVLARLPMDTLFAHGNHYQDTLTTGFRAALKSISHQHRNITWFQPEYISNCDFQQQCARVRIAPAAGDSSYCLEVDGMPVSTPVVSDRGYYGFNNSAYHSGDIGAMVVGSVRFFSGGKRPLVVVHLATGRELPIIWRTAEEAKASGKPEQEFREKREYRPEIPFDDRTHSVCEEPLLHHGYGYDLMFWLEPVE